MPTLKQKIEEELKDAMRKGEAAKLSTIRLLASAIHNKEIQLQKKEEGLPDEEIIEVLRSEVKKRKDAAEEFRKGGREDMASREEEEGKILSSYLPPEITDEELERILKDGIREAGAKDQKDFGKVMKVAMPTLKGRASGDRISAALKRLLSK